MTPTLVTQDRRVIYKKMEEEQGETGDEASGKNSKKQLEVLRQAGNKRALREHNKSKISVPDTTIDKAGIHEKPFTAVTSKDKPEENVATKAL